MLRTLTPMQRRRFLQAAGLTGASLWLPSWPCSRAAAQAAPRRIVFVLNSHGRVHKDWAIRPVGAPAVQALGGYDGTRQTPNHATWDLDLQNLPRSAFSRNLAPLYDLRRHLLVIDGLAMLTAMTDPHGDGHAKGWCSAMNGRWAARTYDGIKSFAAAPSIDQRIAEFLRATDAGLSDLASLELIATPYAGGGGISPFHQYLYRASGGSVAKVPAESGPRNAFERLFPSEGQGSAGALQRDDVLNRVKAQYDAMLPRLSVADREKVSLHRDTVLDLQRRLGILLNKSCAAPVLPAVPTAGGADIYRAKIDAFVDLIGVALRCDLTRIVTLQLDEAPPEVAGTTGEIHHAYAHPSSPEYEFRSDLDSGFTLHEHLINRAYFDQATEIMSRYTEYYASVVARIAERLQAIPEGEGTLLDQTAIVWLGELANGGHGHDQWPAVIVGGCGGALRTGRSLRLPRDQHLRLAYSHGYFGRSHTQLLVSLCQTMGLPLEHFGQEYLQNENPDGSARTIRLSGRLAEIHR